MKIPVSEFKARCSQIFRTIEEQNETIQVTKRGRVVAVVRAPSIRETDPKEFLGCLQGTVSYSDDWDAPLGEKDWDACSQNI